MSKKEQEQLDALEKWKTQKEIEDGIRKGLTKWAITICISATTTAIAVLNWLGAFLYDKWEPLQVAIKAYLAAIRGQ